MVQNEQKQEEKLIHTFEPIFLHVVNSYDIQKFPIE